MTYTRQTMQHLLDQGIGGARRENVELFMILASGNGELSRVVRTNIGKAVGEFLLDNVRGALERKLIHDDLSLLKYRPLLQPDTESILYEEIGNVPGLEYILMEMRRSDLPLLSLEELDLLGSYAIRVSKDVVAFKKYSSTKLLQKNKFIAVLGENGTFTKLKGTAAALDRTIDCLAYGTGIFILSSAGAFESIFDHGEVMDSFIEENADDLKQLGLVDDVQPFVALCQNDSYKRKKLFGVLSRRELLKKLKPKEIAARAKLRKLDLQFDEDGHAIIDTPRRARDYLKLLDEDFFTGDWTGQEYGAHSKEAR